MWRGYSALHVLGKSQNLRALVSQEKFLFRTHNSTKFTCLKVGHVISCTIVPKMEQLPVLLNLG